MTGAAIILVFLYYLAKERAIMRAWRDVRERADLYLRLKLIELERSGSITEQEANYYRDRSRP